MHLIKWVIDHEIGMQKLNPYAIPFFFSKDFPLHYINDKKKIANE